MIRKNKFSLMTLCLLIACHTQNIRHDSGSTNRPSGMQIDSNYNYVNLIPDSLRTPEQRHLLKRLGKIVVDYVEVKNNHMVFTLSREQLLSMGIPSQYYDIIEKNIRDNNAYFDKNRIKGVDSMWENTRLETKDSFK